ncbi:MAG: DegV family protein [Eubacterium sp.]|nr:DegV family protein [Eubacterium sp.]
MKVAILTDTNSGIDIKNAEKMGIYILPMPLMIEEREYLEGVDINHTKLFEALAVKKDVHTSQPSPGAIMDMVEKIKGDGFDQIVYIPMSSGLSTSCATATALADDFPGELFVVDNHRISITMVDAVLDAKYMAEQGENGQQIKEYLEKTAYDSSIYISVDNLYYLKKGGRVTAAGAAIAAIMNIKPVLTIQGGKLDAFSKARSMKLCRKRMIEAIKSDREKRFGEYSAERLSIGVAGAFDKEEDAREWYECVREAFPEHDVFYAPLSCSVACHVGMNAIGVGITVKLPRPAGDNIF